MRPELPSSYIVRGNLILRRGLWWFLFDRGDGARRLGCHVVRDHRQYWIGDRAVNFVTPLDELIDEAWPEAIELAQEAGVEAQDKVPWEIHMIEDEEAHRAALEAYKAAM